MREISQFKIQYNSPPTDSQFDYSPKLVQKLPTSFPYNDSWEIELDNNMKLRYDSEQHAKIKACTFFKLPDINSINVDYEELELLSSMLLTTMLHQYNGKVKLIHKLTGDYDKKLLKYYPEVKLAYAEAGETGYLINYQISAPSDDRFSDPKPALITIFNLIQCSWPMNKDLHKYPFKNKK